MVDFRVVFLEGRRLCAAGGVEALAAVGAGVQEMKSLRFHRGKIGIYHGN